MFTVGIITVSDKGAAGQRKDLCKPIIEELIGGIGGEVIDYRIVPDEQRQIADRIVFMADDRGVDLVLTTGGTGFSPRDVTPEATLSVIERQVPGIPEAIRCISMQSTPNAMLSRAISGIRGKTLIINLPGSPRGVTESLEIILPALSHGLLILQGKTGECGSPPSKV